jgi:hypothetical protein
VFGLILANIVRKKLNGSIVQTQAGSVVLAYSEFEI